MIIAMASVDGTLDEAEFAMGARIIKASWRLKRLSAKALQKIVKEQSRILQTDFDKALEALPVLLKAPKDRTRAVKLATDIAWSDNVLKKKEKDLLRTMKKVLGLP